MKKWCCQGCGTAYPIKPQGTCGNCGYHKVGASITGSGVFVEIDGTPPLSNSEKFFAHLNNGEVSIEVTPSEFVKTNYTGSQGYHSKPSYRVVISPKVGE